MDTNISFSNYRVPSEWEKQKLLCLIWPNNQETWQGYLKIVQNKILKLIQIALKYQEVHLFTSEDMITEMLPMGKYSLRIHYYESNDCWIRDYGAINVVHIINKQSVLLDFEFNSWGGKYTGFQKDNGVIWEISKQLDIPRYSIDMVLEGGSIEMNGNGLLLSTKSTLFNPNRNPKLTPVQILQKLKNYFGVQEFLWLSGGIVGDDTDGHIDQLARFVDTKIVLCPLAKNVSHPHYLVLKENYKRMEVYANKHKLELVEFVHPPKLVLSNLVLPASYMNFVLLNKAFLLPAFDEKTDNQAMDIVESLNLKRKVELVSSNEILFGKGGIHCLSLNIF